jgi:gliding motility-associated-like protein
VLNINTVIKQYTWDFGDGGTATGAAPQHTYTKEGIYAVKVTIETEDGCTNTYTLKNAVFAGHKPHADFTGQFDSTCTHQGIYFQNTSTNGPITFLQWNGTQIRDSASGQVYYFSPVDTGYRSLTLVAFNYGCADTITKDHVIYALPPIARMEVKLNCSDKTLVNFTDNSITDIEHTWDFGDSTKDVTKNPSHVYASPGTYTINLYVENKTCKDTATKTIHVINEKGTMFLPGSAFCRETSIDADITGINIDNIKNTRWNFGDGTLITVNGGTKTTHVYTTTGKYKVTAFITDLNNCQYFYSWPDSVSIYGPTANYISSQPDICSGYSALFRDKSKSDGIHNITSWTWDYGDYFNYHYYSSQIFSHVYLDTGHYSPQLIVTDSYGCSDTMRRNKYIYVSHPYASFSIGDSIVCPGTSVPFKDKSTGNNLQYVWDFGDASPQSTNQNPYHKYKQSGTYWPSLTVTDDIGCKDGIISASILVSVPTANFSMSDSLSTCPPLPVQFTDSSTNYNTLSWEFGDGSSSVIDTPTHIYTYPGNYTAKLIAKGYGNCADTLTKKIVIKGPTGKLIYNSKPLCSPAVVNFSATAKHTKTYAWDYSDGNVDVTIKNQSTHTYDTGFFVPKLILTDSLGCKVSITGSDTVKIYNVTANAQVSAGNGCDSALIKFTDISESKDAITHHYWYFGDNDSADAAQITHLYNKTGAYNATLIAVTKLGCTDTLNLSSPITIYPSPHISIIGDSVACALAQVNFRGTSSLQDPTIQWDWKFNNDSAASGQKVNTSYKTGGNYVVSLIATTATGCADTTSHKIKINSPPPVNVGPDTSVCQNSIYQLNATGAFKYKWQGPGLSCINCASPNVTVDSFATYKVTGIDEIGCTATDSISLKAIAPSHITVSGDDTLCIGEKTQFAASGAVTYQWYPSQYLDNDKSSTPVFTASTDTAITYKVIGSTEHNCFSDTGFVFVKTYPVPHMNFQSNDITLSVGSSVRLISNSSADITQWQWTPSAGLDNAGSANPLASPRQTTTYTCIASNGGGCVSRDQVTIRVICKNTNVFIPNTFSPNGDGMNDIFFPRGTGLFNIKSFRIFNRWGQLIFERYNVAPNTVSQGWNGTYNGKDVQTDVYVYMMEVVCENGSIIPMKGNVTLLR